MRPSPERSNQSIRFQFRLSVIEIVNQLAQEGVDESALTVGTRGMLRDLPEFEKNEIVRLSRIGRIALLRRGAWDGQKIRG